MAVNKSSDASVGEKNKQNILQAAEKVFAQQGLKGSSVQQIADTAGLPKTNVLYYFKTKQSLYQAVLQQTLSLWNSRFDQASATDDPAETLAEYISEKIDMSRTHPLLSKIFAMEILNGGPNLDTYFNHKHVSWMQGRVAIIESWIEQQKITRVDPYYLLFTIWASTQHYADFSVQVTRLRGEKMKKVDFEEAKRTVIKLVLTGCGLTVPARYQNLQ
ncbi:TetR family transcriptional regulator C-terminal domain-containing protein [Salinimonas marina]|uniref:TetR family transcriptional regulator C-terminal domain-containing protein n=1 Tax=Salinimonas marina TaxID=2785918 RepID=A0A7S9DVH2_9ALTE|nr:TetR family transcriptional regulator C-terminal domain-containing protein [Salinimonas marina]QPG04592.1 TetR family transcriptional regulator C-terminal domain-containing protein [Salinimonas marina]